MQETEQETEQETKVTLELSNREIKLLKLLNEAPNELKTIYYLNSKTNRNYTNLYRDVKTLEMKGALVTHKSSLSGKVFYIPKVEVIEAIKDYNVLEEDF